MKKIILVIFYIFTTTNLLSVNKQFKEGLLISEICIEPEKKEFPTWIELWNNSTEDLNLKNYNINIKNQNNIIKEDLFIKQGEFALVLVYSKSKISKLFEDKIPKGISFIRLFNTKISENIKRDDYRYYLSDSLNGFVIIYDNHNKSKTSCFWNILDDKYFDRNQKIIDNLIKNKKYGHLINCHEILIESGIYFHLLPSSFNDIYYSFIKKNNNSLGKQYPVNISPPNIEKIDIYTDIMFGINLSVVFSLYSSYELDKINNWSKPFLSIYEKNNYSKENVLKNNTGSMFYFRMEKRTYCYFLGNNLYMKIGQENKDGKVVFGRSKNYCFKDESIINSFNDSEAEEKSFSLKEPANKTKYQYISKNITNLELIVKEMRASSPLKDNESGQIDDLFFIKNKYWVFSFNDSAKDIPYKLLTKIDNIGFSFYLEKDLSENELFNSLKNKVDFKYLRIFNHNSKYQNVDLSPLIGISLKVLDIKDIGKVDLRPLINSKLEEIILTVENCKNIEILKEIKTLKFINNVKIDEFF